MNPGPKPTPSAVLKLRGSRRADGRPDVSDMTVEVPARPAWLPKQARREWARVVPLLRERGTIQKLDRFEIASHCVALADYAHFTELIAKAKRPIKGGHNNLYALRDKAWAIAQRTALELGLTPASRTRVPMKKRDIGAKKKGGLAERLASGG